MKRKEGVSRRLALKSPVLVSLCPARRLPLGQLAAERPVERVAPRSAPRGRLLWAPHQITSPRNFGAATGGVLGSTPRPSVPHVSAQQLPSQTVMVCT